MKILIVHASAGAGHRRAAQAIHEYVRTVKDIERVDCVDVFDYAPWLFRILCTRGYGFLINRLSWLWAAAFGLTSEPGRSSRPFLLVFAARVYLKRFAAHLIRERYDAVVSTHFLASCAAGLLKDEGSIPSLLYTVITDFGVHPFWIEPRTDRYIVASDETRRILTQAGVPFERVLVLGIPVSGVFYAPHSRDAIRRRLGIPRSAFMVLVVTGSFGIGPLAKIALLLSRQGLWSVVVCARNASLLRFLLARRVPGVVPLGFVDTMHELMAAADAIITKPGGLTCSEIIACTVPPVFISAIPGQETENVRILKEHGIGSYASTPLDAATMVLDWRNHPQKISDIRANAAAIRHPLTAKELYHALCADCGRPAS